jgi:transposase InsO family protein
MVDGKSVVTQAHEIQCMVKELEFMKIVVPDEFVARDIIAKLAPLWRDFATALKHKRVHICILDLITSLDVKKKALNCFKTYKDEVENQLEKKIKHFRSDRGGEYFSNEFDLFCVEHGIIHERTPPYSPQSNGVGKRKNHTLTDLVNYMLDTAGLSKAWWG